MSANLEKHTAERRAGSAAPDGGQAQAPRRTVRIGGVRLIADLASEPRAFARKVARMNGGVRGRQIAVLSGAGERRRELLAALGQRCAGDFDALVVYESTGAGGAEQLGRSARAILEGASRCRGGHPQRHCKLDVRHALRFALSLCHPGDIVVFACASLDTLIDAMQTVTGLPPARA